MYNIEDIEKLNNDKRFIDYLNSILYKVYYIRHPSYIDDKMMVFTLMLN
jgi:hypothetical protein